MLTEWTRLGLLNSLLGLLSTLMNILITQKGYTSVTAKITISVISGICRSMLCWCIMYNYLLSELIWIHEREVTNSVEQR